MTLFGQVSRNCGRIDHDSLPPHCVAAAGFPIRRAKAATQDLHPGVPGSLAVARLPRCRRISNPARQGGAAGLATRRAKAATQDLHPGVPGRCPAVLGPTADGGITNPASAPQLRCRRISNPAGQGGAPGLSPARQGGITNPASAPQLRCRRISNPASQGRGHRTTAQRTGRDYKSRLSKEGPASALQIRCRRPLSLSPDFQSAAPGRCPRTQPGAPASLAAAGFPIRRARTVPHHSARRACFSRCRRISNPASQGSPARLSPASHGGITNPASARGSRPSTSNPAPARGSRLSTTDSLPPSSLAAAGFPIRRARTVPHHSARRACFSRCRRISNPAGQGGAARLSPAWQGGITNPASARGSRPSTTGSLPPHSLAVAGFPIRRARPVPQGSQPGAPASLAVAGFPIRRAKAATQDLHPGVPGWCRTTRPGVARRDYKSRLSGNYSRDYRRDGT